MFKISPLWLLMSTLNLLVMLIKLSLHTISSTVSHRFMQVIYFSWQVLSFQNLLLVPVPVLIFLNETNQNCEQNSKWGLSKSLHNANNVFFAGNIVPGTQSCICLVDTHIIEPPTIAVFFCWVFYSQQPQSTPQVVATFSTLKWWILF